MPTTLNWIEDGHILEYRMEGVVSAQDMRQMLAAEADFYQATPHTVHVLFDVTAMTKLPPNPILYVRQSCLLTRKRGHVAIIGACATVRLLTDIIANFSGRHDHTFHCDRQHALEQLYGILYAESGAGV